MDSLMRYISRISRLSHLYRDEKLESYGLNGIHHTYLFAICRNPGVSQEDLAGMIFVNKSNVARQLAILSENGYITRVQSSMDKRKMLVYPTEKAHEILPILIKVLGDWNDAMLSGFSLEEQKLLLFAMEKILEKAKNVMKELEDKSL